MPYNPSIPVDNILIEALREVRAVPYAVTARWVFYRLLQSGTFNQKGDYKRLLSYLSRARKEWYGGWTPDTLTDDTREAVVRGSGFNSPQEWADAIARQECNLDRWKTQYGVPENPERPGTYQWEGLDDDAAQAMIGLANDVVDEVSFTQVQDREDSVTRRFRTFMSRLEIQDDEEEDDDADR